MNSRRLQTLSAAAAVALLAGMPVGAQQTAASKASSQVPTENVQTDNSKPSNETTSKTEAQSKASQTPAADQESTSTKAQGDKQDPSNPPASNAEATSTVQTESGGQTAGAARPVRGVVAKRKDYGQFSSQDFAQAPAMYQLELQRAKDRGDSKAEAAFALKQARAFDFLSGTDQRLSEKAVAAYKQAIAASVAAGDPVQRSMAANNLAVLLLRQGKVSEAAQAVGAIDLSSISSSSISKSQQSIFRFNIGRAQELNGNTWEAYTQYSEAFTSNPGMVSALQGAFRTLGKQPALPVAEAATLSDRATANGLPDIANEQLLNLLESWDDLQLKQNQAGAERLMAALLGAYAAQEVTPPLFRTREAPRLHKISSIHNSLTEMIKEIEAAFLGTFPFDPREAAVGLAAWRSNQQSAQTMAVVLEHIADFYATNEQPKMALGRYGAGWEIAHAPQCAVKYSSLLSRNAGLDPDDRLVDRLVEDIFIEKGQAYIMGDWTHILPLHIALGTIFEERGKWQENGDPRGALFQWQHAIAADVEVRRRNLSTPPSPGLHVHLGNVFRAIKRNEDAVREFLTAGEGFIAAGDLAEARKSAQIILEVSPGGLSGSFSANDRSRWEELARVTGTT